jgi:hypothetical protein
LAYRHNGEAYDLTPYDLSAQGITGRLWETRAAVALLTRNIRIVSAVTRSAKIFPPRILRMPTVTSAGKPLSARDLPKCRFREWILPDGAGGMLAHSPLCFSESLTRLRTEARLSGLFDS